MFKRNVLTFLCMLLIAPGLHAQRQELEAYPALMKLIRGEKFDVVLPQAMRDNDIDMWIHVIRGEDPLNFELGDDSGIYIFTDRGAARIERAVLGGQADRERYDVFGPESDLGSFVAERDPERIAVNFKRELAPWPTYRGIEDGLSHADYLLLTEELGEQAIAIGLSSLGQ